MRPQERAVVTRLHPRELVDACIDGIGDPMEDLGAVLRHRAPPRVEAGVSRRDRGVDLDDPSACHLCDRLLVDRRHVGEPIDRCDAGPRDEVVGRDLHAFDHGTVARRRLPSNERVVRVRTNSRR
jgi:hypothetical protein